MTKPPPTYTGMGLCPTQPQELPHFEWQGSTGGLNWAVLLSRYTNHKANPDIQLFSTFLKTGEGKKTTFVLFFFNLPIFDHIKFSLPKKTVPCAALIRSYNHPKMKMATGARSLLSHWSRFTMTASISHKPNSMWDAAFRCNLQAEHWRRGFQYFKDFI